MTAVANVERSEVLEALNPTVDTCRKQVELRHTLGGKSTGGAFYGQVRAQADISFLIRNGYEDGNSNSLRLLWNQVMPAPQTPGSRSTLLPFHLL